MIDPSKFIESHGQYLSFKSACGKMRVSPETPIGEVDHLLRYLLGKAIQTDDEASIDAFELTVHVSVEPLVAPEPTKKRGWFR